MPILGYFGTFLEPHKKAVHSIVDNIKGVPWEQQFSFGLKLVDDISAISGYILVLGDSIECSWSPTPALNRLTG